MPKGLACKNFTLGCDTSNAHLRKSLAQGKPMEDQMQDTRLRKGDSLEC